MLFRQIAASLCAVAAFCVAAEASAQKTPNAPGTGPFSVQTFAGGTKRVMLALNPPTTYSDGTPIKNGTGVTIRIYRSLDGGKTFGTRVRTISGGQGFVGQGKAGSRTKPWIDLVVETPVDGRAPYQVLLGATSVIRGKESAMTTANLSFQYFPSFQRIDAPVPPAPADPAAPGEGGLEGRWTLAPHAGTLVVTRRGNTFTAVISGDGQSFRFGGTVSGRTYAFTFNIPFGEETLSGNGTLTLSTDGRSIDLVARANGVKKPVVNRLAISGRTITIPKS